MKNNRFKRFSFYSLFISLLSIASSSHAAEPDWTQANAQTESVFSDLDGGASPGCAIGVIHQEKYIFSKGYGLANLEHQIPIGPQTVFRVASISKQFTATAIAILEERGELDVDDDIHQYLPELPNYGEEVTLRQIIHHISGIPDYEEYGPPFTDAVGNNFDFLGTDYYSTDEFYALIATLPLEHSPETTFEYSNTGYVLLAEVIERLTGKSLREFAQEEIFRPLGMANTFFLDNVNEVIPNRADGYREVEGGYELFMANNNWVGDGSLFTTLEDFLAWDRNFYENRLGQGRQQFIDALQTPHPIYDTLPPADTFADGRIAPYAWGLFVMEYRGLTEIGHAGDWVGFRSHYLRFPELELSFVGFCNSRQLLITRRINAIRDAYIDVLEGLKRSE